MANYMLQAHRLSGNSDQECAKALFDAIRCLDTGFFGNHVEELSHELHALFDDVPIIRNEKQLGELTYKSTGIVYDKENHVIPMPSFETETEPDDGRSDGSDVKRRMDAIKKVNGWYFRNGDLTLRQLAWAMSGKQPKTRNGVVGKSLYKITGLVEKMERTLAENPDIDMELVFYGAYSKMHGEACGPISVGAHDDNYETLYDCPDAKPYMHHTTVYRIKCANGNLVDNVAAVLSKGQLSHDRIYPAMSGLREERNKESAGFAPLASVVSLKHYIDNDALEAMVEKDCPEPEAAKTANDKKMKKRYVASYVSDMLRSVTWTLQAVYDATEAYAAYDSITDERARDFLLDAGYIIKDWQPDPDLWYRASKFMFPSKDGETRYGGCHYMRTLPEDVRKRHRDMAYRYLQERFAILHEDLSDGRMKKIRETLLSQ